MPLFPVSIIIGTENSDMNSERHHDPFLPGDLTAIKPFTFVERGSGMALRPFTPTEDALARLVKWESDPDVTAFYYAAPETRTEERIREIRTRDYTVKGLACYFVHARDGEAVGWMSLYDWGGLAKNVEVSIMIGEKSRWGEGLGSTAVTTGLLVARNRGFRRGIAITSSQNLRSMALFERFPHRREPFMDQPSWIQFAIPLAKVDFAGLDVEAFTADP